MRCLLFLILFTLPVFSDLSVRPYLESAYLIRGEKTHFVLETTEKIKNTSKLPKSELYSITAESAFENRSPQGSRIFHYKYALSSLHLGQHKIPSFDITLDNGVVYKCPSLTFRVYPSSVLKFKKVKIAEREISYATALFIPERDLYLGETVPAELKVYLPFQPAYFSVIDYGVAEMKRDGISAWRFQNDRNTRNNSPSPFFTPSGQTYSITYKSSAHAIRIGKVSIGDGDVRPVFRAVSSNLGIQRWVDLPMHLPIEKIRRNAIPLPSGAPNSFKGAVGDFSLDVAIENPVRNSSTDPITLNLNIAGTGNLNKIEPPLLKAQDGAWKVYPATKKQREAERRFLSGTVEFTQILRPTSKQNEIPPFEFTFFNPKTKSYSTLTSKPINLQLAATSNSDIDEPPANPEQPQRLEEPSNPPTIMPSAKENDYSPIAPQETMTDVLGLIAPPYLDAPKKSTLWKYWQIFPALLSVILLINVFFKHLLPSLQPSEKKKSMKHALQELKSTKDPIPFLKKASLFSHAYLNKDEYTPLKQEIDKARDEQCYSSPKTIKPSFNDSMKGQLLKKLTQASKSVLSILLLTFITLHSDLKAEKVSDSENVLEQAYDYSQEGDFSSALSTYLSAYPDANFPVDILYNIGTCYAKLDEPGQAALYYRKALIKDPEHKEALQNLRYLEKAKGSIILQRTGLARQLAKAPLTLFKTILYALIWSLILTTLLLFTLSSRRKRATVWSILTLATILLPFCIASILLYPKDGAFASTDQIAVITSSDTVTARTEASNTASRVIKAPPGSIVKVLKQRGLWAYLEFANNTRGWLNTKHLTMLSPESQLEEITPVEETSDL